MLKRIPHAPARATGGPRRRLPAPLFGCLALDDRRDNPGRRRAPRVDAVRNAHLSFRVRAEREPGTPLIPTVKAMRLLFPAGRVYGFRARRCAPPRNDTAVREPMLLGVIADDFTGASDIANTLAKGRARDRAVPRPADDAGARDLRGRRRRAEEPLDRRGRRGRALDRGVRVAAGAGLPAIRVQVLLDLRFDAGGQYRPGRRGAGATRSGSAASSPARRFPTPAARSTRAISSSATGSSTNRASRTIPSTR